MTDIKALVTGSRPRVAVVGGDMRSIYASGFLEEQGCECVFSHMETYKSCLPIKDAARNVDAILFGVPMMKNDLLNAPFSSCRTTAEDVTDLQSTEARTVVMGGMIPENVSDALTRRGYRVVDLCKSETFNYKNAIPTAEGAIALAINHTGVTVDGSKMAIIGYGRIGRCLGRRLKALGSEVTVYARSERDVAEALSEGFRVIRTESIGSSLASADAVFNTVPSRVLFAEQLSHIREETPVIELASRPGGIEPADALSCGTRVISAQSLPGRVAPVTAGKIIADLLVGSLREGQI